VDKILLRGLRFRGRHGVLPRERADGQVFQLDIELRLDLEPAGRSDDLEDTVNYAAVYEEVKAVVEGPPLRLVEALAQRVADRLFATQPLLRAVKVRVGKPEPPIEGDLDFVGVEIERER
jgi:dihydroneopterin aldolase